MKVKLLFKDNKSNKFWNITAKGLTTTVEYGRTGSKARLLNVDHKTKNAMSNFVDKSIQSKLKKGYVILHSTGRSIKSKPFNEKKFKVKHFSEIVKLLDPKIQKSDIVIFHYQDDIQFKNPHTFLIHTNKIIKTKLTKDEVKSGLLKFTLKDYNIKTNKYINVENEFKVEVKKGWGYFSIPDDYYIKVISSPSFNKYLLNI